MSKVDLAALVVELLSAIQSLGGYPISATLPNIYIVPQEHIQRVACEGPCRVKAFYSSDEGIFLVDTLNVKEDLVDRSILVHELVHHLQHTSGKFEDAPSSCQRRSAEELEAYQVQSAYLARISEVKLFPTSARSFACDPGETVR